MVKRQKMNSDQIPLFEPPTSWREPTSLPDPPRGGVIAIDTEDRDNGLSTGRGPGWVFKDGHLAGVSVAWRAGTEMRSIYVPLRHPDSANMDLEQTARWLKAVMEGADTIVFQNAPFDIGWLSTDGIEVPFEKIEDIHAMAVMLDENQLSYSLDSICRSVGVPGKDERLLREAAAAFGCDPKAELWKLPARHVGEYAEQDAVSTLMCWERMRERIDEEELREAYQLEMDLIPMIMAMRRRGIRINESRAESTMESLRQQRDEVLDEIARQLAWPSFTMDHANSPGHLERAFDQEQVQYLRTPKTKRGSFKSDWMKDSDHWLPSSVAKARALSDMSEKFIGNYILDAIHVGRVHAEIHQLRDDSGGTRSYRLSYSNPPLQQMPARDPVLAPLVRSIFESERDTLWGSADYCHDEETEILTEHGWRLFSDLDRIERVAQWHEDGTLSWVLPTDHYIGPVRTRELVHVHGPRQVDFRVTGEHSCIVQRGSRYERTDAAEIERHRCRGHFPQAGKLVGGVTTDHDLLRLVVALQADAADRGGTWRFYMNRTRKLERLAGILTRLGIQYRVTERAKGDQTAIVIDDRPEIREWLSDEKIFRLDRLLSLDEESRRVFLEELPHWDGKWCGETISYGSVRRQNVDAVQCVAAVTGRRAATHVAKIDGRQDFHHVTLSPRCRTGFTRTMHVDRETVTGRVYCVTVPSHAIVTRRRGHVLVSGQSQQEPRMAVHFAAICRLRGSEAAVAYYRDNPGADFHQMVSDITGVPRKQAKIINLGLMYGMGMAKLAASLGVTVEEAKRIVEQYNSRMPFVEALADFCTKRATQRGFIRLLDGARCRFDQWEPSWRENDEEYHPPCSRAKAEEVWPGRRLRRAFTHKAMNRLVQGSSARQTKLAMRECWRQGILPMLQLHDELDFSCASDEQGHLAAEIMADVLKLSVPMLVDVQYGRDWGEASIEPPKGEEPPGFDEIWSRRDE